MNKGIPEIIKEYGRSCGMDQVRLVVADHPIYGAVYDFHHSYNERYPLPTGFPVMASYKDDKCTPISGMEALDILASL